MGTLGNAKRFPRFPQRKPSVLHSIQSPGGIMKYWASIRRAYSQIRDYGANEHRTYANPRDSACPVQPVHSPGAMASHVTGVRLYQAELSLYPLILILLFRSQKVLCYYDDLASQVPPSPLGIHFLPDIFFPQLRECVLFATADNCNRR